MLNQAAMKLNVSRIKYDTSLSMAFNFCSMSNNESLRKNDRNVPLETLQKTRKIPVTNYKNNSKKISFDKSVRLNKELLCIKSIKGKLKDMSEVSFSKIIKNGASKELLDGYNTVSNIYSLKFYYLPELVTGYFEMNLLIISPIRKLKDAT